MNEEFDRIRKKIGIDQLDEAQRKKLFREFVEHGGEIIEEKGEEPKPAPVKLQYPQATSARPARSTEKPRGTPGKPPAPSRKKTKPFTGLKIFIRGLASKVFSFNGKISDRFVWFFRGEGKSHFLHLSLTVSSFFKDRTSILKEIKKASTGQDSTFYEILVRLRALYDDKEFATIQKAIGRKHIPSGPYIEIFKNFFKKMYILGQYTDISKYYCKKAILIQQKSRKLSPEDAEAAQTQIQEDIDVILIDLLSRFHALICKINNVYYPLFSQELDDLLGMTEQDEIGYITLLEKKKRAEELKRIKEYLKKKKEESHEKAEVEVKVPKHIQRGLPVLQKAIEDFERTGIGEESDFSLFDRSDKMYRSALLMEVFEKEYSFVLTTGKMVFNIDYREQKKIDIKEDLNHAYLLFSEARHDVKDYIDILKEYRKTNDNLRLTLHQKTTLLESLNKKRSIASRTARQRIVEAMKAVQNTLSTVIDDYNSSKRLLENAEETLVFNERLDGPKRLHNRKVIEAIVEVFLFASSFAFLLTYGELSGSGLHIDSFAEKIGT